MSAEETAIAEPETLADRASKWAKRAAVWDKSDGRCHYCRVELHPFRTFTIDHLIPKNCGGTNALENLVAACPTCNHARTVP